MGCDIHATIEVRNRKFDGFSFEFNFEGIRSYSLFATMAGVRNDSGIVPISKPRGIPKDSTRETLKEYELWDGDAHSASYLNFSEFKEAVFRNPNCPICYDACLRYMEEYEKNGYDTRIIFWFDN